MTDKLAPVPVTLTQPDTSCPVSVADTSQSDEILDPCTTGRELAEMAGLPTCCDLNRLNNVWVEGEYPETGAVCMLDNLTIASISEILTRDPRARQDLVKVTSNPYLRDLAAQVPQLSTQDDGDRVQKQASQILGAGPFYTLFRGQIP